MKETTTVFNIPMFPDRDFAVICSAIRLDRYSSLKSVMSVQLMGWTKDMAWPIEQHKIKSIARSQVNDFKFVFKKLREKYDRLSVRFSVDNSQLYLVNFKVAVSDFFYTYLGQSNFFSLRKGEKVQLKIEGDKDFSDAEKYYLIEKRKQDLKVNPPECNPK